MKIDFKSEMLWLFFTYETLSFSFFFPTTTIILPEYRTGSWSSPMPGTHYIHTPVLSCMLGPISSLRPNGCYSPPSLNRRRGPHAAPHPSVQWWHSLSCILFKTAKTLSLTLNHQEYPTHSRSLKANMVTITVLQLQHEESSDFWVSQSHLDR